MRYPSLFIKWLLTKLPLCEGPARHGACQNILHLSDPFTTLWIRYYTHFTGEETGSQMIFPSLHSELEAGCRVGPQTPGWPVSSSPLPSCHQSHLLAENCSEVRTEQHWPCRGLSDHYYSLWALWAGTVDTFVNSVHLLGQRGKSTETLSKMHNSPYKCCPCLFGTSKGLTLIKLTF